MAMKTLFRKAEKLFVERKYSQAVDFLNTIIDLQPNNDGAYCCRAVCLSCLDKMNGAFTDINNAIRLNHNFAMAYVNRANFYIRQEKYQEAISDLNKVQEIGFDENAGLYCKIAASYLGLDMNEEAFTAIKMALDSEPLDEDCLMTLANYYQKTEDFENTELVIRKILEINPLNTDAQVSMGMIYWELHENLAEAMYFLNLARVLGHPDAASCIGEIETEMEDK